MSYYDKIYEYTADNYGLITSNEAHSIGIPRVELAKLSKRGRLARLGHGVYKVMHYIPTPLDKYAEAVTLAGKNAYLYGESVLAMHGLALVNPAIIYVATKDRVRRNLPAYVNVTICKDRTPIVSYEGIPSQSVYDAIMACRTSVMSERLFNAADEARKQGLITEKEAESARKGLSK